MKLQHGIRINLNLFIHQVLLVGLTAHFSGNISIAFWFAALPMVLSGFL